MISVYLSLLLLTEVYARDISAFNLHLLKSTMPQTSQGTVPEEQISTKDSDAVKGKLFKPSDIAHSPSLSTTETPHTTTYSTAVVDASPGPHGHSIRRLDKKVLRVGSSRRKRHNKSINHEGIKRRSCQTKSKYDFKEKAVDMFGHAVQVYPYIHIGNLSIDQYFYESFCDAEKCECSGIDNKKFRSSCETDYTFTYAKIVKGGEIGWTHIKIRSGCSCKIHKVNAGKAFNIMDLIKRQ